MVKDENVEVRGSALISLAIQGRALDQKPLLALLQDSEPRVRGAAALVASRTMQRNDPRVAEVLPLLSENLKLTIPWTRMNTVSAVGALAPLGSVPVARALIDAYKAEKDERLKPHYLSVLKVLTGAEGNDAGPYEEWLKHPTTPPPPAPPAPKPETPPAPKPETPPAPKPETPPAPKPETPPAPKPETPPAPKPETPPAPKSETPPAPKPKG
jgi:outer membrane biosynthesis protein TonB